MPVGAWEKLILSSQFALDDAVPDGIDQATPSTQPQEPQQNSVTGIVLWISDESSFTVCLHDGQVGVTVGFGDTEYTSQSIRVMMSG